MHKRGLRWRRVRGATHPGGHGAPPPALLPGPARDGRPGDRHDLLGAPGRAGRRQRRQGAQGPLVPRVPTAPAGVGYDVEYLLYQICRELGLTQDWPVAIVGVGNLGQALANYRGFGARGFRVVAARRRRPREGRARASATSRSSRSTTCPTIARDARRRHRHHRHARARGAGRRRPPRRRGRHVDPQLRPDGRDRARRRLAAQGRPRHRAADPVLLPTATRRRPGAPRRATHRRAAARRRRRRS